MELIFLSHSKFRIPANDFIMSILCNFQQYIVGYFIYLFHQWNEVLMFSLFSGTVDRQGRSGTCVCLSKSQFTLKYGNWMVPIILCTYTWNNKSRIIKLRNILKNKLFIVVILIWKNFEKTKIDSEIEQKCLLCCSFTKYLCDINNRCSKFENWIIMRIFFRKQSPSVSMFNHRVHVITYLSVRLSWFFQYSQLLNNFNFQENCICFLSPVPKRRLNLSKLMRLEP